MEPPVTTPSVHPNGFQEQLLETIRQQMLTNLHFPHNASKGYKLLLLTAQ